MGFCGGRREKDESPAAEQKWDYINLGDFKSTSCLTPMSYGILYISLVISLACYAVDLFTAINLLVFDRWSGQIKPVVPFTITRWIFAGCIILSWILLAYRWYRAVRAMRSGGVAQSYLDPLAVRVQSVRTGERGQGYRRFLVFAELTKSKKGSEYLALFTYFSFEAWLRIVFAEGPRNAINAMTLYSVMRLNLLPNGEHTGNHTPAIQFFYNVQALANENKEQAAIYFGMLFTLVIWLFAALGFILACIFYVVFLWHHIPAQDGSLSGFCKRKIDSRLQKIVSIKVNKALKKQNDMLSKNSSKSNIGLGELKRQPTLPNLDVSADDKLPEMPMLPRRDTQTTLPPYSSRPPTRNEDPMPGLNRQPTIPDVSPISPLTSRPTFPSQSGTQVSAMSKQSYNSNAPLLSDAQEPGYGPPGHHYALDDRPPVNRSFTNGSQVSNRSRPQYRNGPPPGYESRNPSYSSQNGPGPRGYPSRQNTNTSDNFNPGPLTRQGTDQSFQSARSGPPQSYTPFDAQGRRTPAMGPRLPYNPQRQNTNMSANSAPNPYPPQRQNTNMSSASEPTPFQPRGPQRQNTNATIASTISRSASASRFQAYTPMQTASPVDISPPPLPTFHSIPPSLTPAPRPFSPQERPYSPSQSRNFSAPTRLGSPQVTPTFAPQNAPLANSFHPNNNVATDYFSTNPASVPPPAANMNVNANRGATANPSMIGRPIGQPGMPRQVEQQRPMVVRRSGSAPLMEAQSARIESGGSYAESIFDAYGGSMGMSGERQGMGGRGNAGQMGRGGRW